MDAGGYVRYDFSTADNLLKTAEILLAEYDSLTNLYKKAKDPLDLERRLQEFRGVGPVTTNIFLREMRHVWPKARPEISPYALDAAKRLSVKLTGLKRETKDFVRLECALLRIGKNYIRKNKPLPIGDRSANET